MFSLSNCVVSRVIVLLIVGGFVATAHGALVPETEPMKCHVCHSLNGCRSAPLQNCTVQVADNTIQLLREIGVRDESRTSAKFTCVSYKATLKNHTMVNIAGCLFDTFNPCEKAIDAIPALEWTCKNCDTQNGCNGNSAASVVPAVMTLVTMMGVAVAVL